jgi:hypothetical protein
VVRQGAVWTAGEPEQVQLLIALLHCIGRVSFAPKLHNLQAPNTQTLPSHRHTNAELCGTTRFVVQSISQTSTQLRSCPSGNSKVHHRVYKITALFPLYDRRSGNWFCFRPQVKEKEWLWLCFLAFRTPGHGQSAKSQ